MNKIFYILAFFLTFQLKAQEADTTSNTRGLMQNEGLQIEATEALNQMYNFKFDVAEAKFQEILRRYPEHPLPYYLVGLSNWWKMMPYDDEHDPRLKQYEPAF